MSVASPSTTSNNPSSSSPIRPSRLRGLSYLRNYTQTHFQHSRDSSAGPTTNSRPSTLIRATSYPATSTTTSPPPASTSQTARQTSPLRSSDAPQSTNTLLRVATAPLDQASTAEDDSEGNAEMGRVRPTHLSRPVDDPVGASDAQAQTPTIPAAANMPSIRLSQHQDPRANRPSLAFVPMQRTLPTGKEVLKVGRYSEREQAAIQAFNVASAAPIGFKSKVVSRRHCEIWAENGSWFIKDVKSSSGTFLNHVRLSSPGQESKPFPVKDGDIVQLGIDFKGGEEMIFRCVKIRVELNRNWQAGLNTFNKAAHQKLRNLTQDNSSPSSAASSQDCSICLGRVAPCQALFVAPCSHTWHYKCVRRILNGPTWPQFVCPNCRAVADLEAEVDEPLEDEEWEEVGNASEIAEPTTSVEATSAAIRPTELDTASAEATSAGPSDAHVSQQARMPSEEAIRASGITGTSMVEVDMDDAPSSIDDSNATSLPIPIRGSISRSVHDENEAQSSSDEMVTSHRTPSDLPHHVLSLIDGPMTPRNDVGPFIFDGSGYAANTRRANTETVESDSGT